MRTFYTILFDLFIGTVAAQNFSGTIEGSLWLNGQSFENNWYFDGKGNACYQLIFEHEERSNDVRLILDGTTGKLTVVTTSNGQTSHYSLHADSLSADGALDMQFVQVGAGERFLEHPTHKYQCDDHEHKGAFWMDSSIDLDLSAFKDFLKEDPAFTFIAENNVDGFPLQVVITDAMGNLKRSFKVTDIKSDLPSEVFTVPSGSTKLEY